MADASLRNAFKTTISNYYVVMLAVLDEYDIITFDWPTEEHEGQAKAILENLAANRIPKDKIDSVLFQLVTLDPFNMDTYSYILNKHGDSENELEKFGEAHGINIRSLKKGIIDSSFYSDITKACENFEEEKEPVQFENKLVSIQSKIDKKKKKMGLTTESECDKMIKKEMKGLGAKYKTVDGVVFQTMEEAKAARKDLKKFYEYLSIHGIESESVCEDIKKIEFKTDIVTANLEKRLEEMKILTNERELGKRIEKVFKGNGFSVASTNNDSLFSEKVFVIGVSKDFTANANRVRKLAGISDKEKIVLMFKNKKQHEDDFFWWVLSNDNLYTFENDDDNVENKKVVPFLDIEFIHADRNGNLVTRIRGEIDRTDTLELSNECEKDSVRENLSKAMEEIRYLIAPLTMGRSASKKTDRKMDVASLDVKKLANNDSWRAAVASCKEVKEHACINDNSPAFKTLLNKAKQYWDCEFEDENVYFVMVDSSIGSSVVLTSARCYIYGKVHSTTQKYVFPIDKISTFRGEGKGKKYLMFFDVDYFKKNYFDCSGGGVCFNTVDFNMFNIPEKTGEYVCRALTSMEKEIRKPMLEKEEKRKYFEKAVTEATDSTKINEVIKVLNNDKILDEDDRKFFLSKLQQKSDKYQNTAANARELEQMVAVIKRDDLAEINSALNKLLKNELYDASDKKAITDLIEIQLEIGSKL
ncbi:MAG: hypothetical protein IJ274_05890, partial [Lachnospiraceae bacterium]|nr:hypothetical protein [Lachnospiraceae bacterium]